jgi:hypothetical protein
MKQKIIRVVKEKSNKTIIDGFIIRSRMYYKNIKIIHQKHFDYVFFFFCDHVIIKNNCAKNPKVKI